MRLSTREEKPREILDPTTGELVPADDADALIDAYERMDRNHQFLRKQRVEVANALADFTTEETKTRYVRGEKRTAKVTMPSDSWNQGILKEAWNSYPKLRDEFLSIERVRVKLREYTKALKTTGPKDFQAFRRIIQMANQGPFGTPRIEVKK